MKVQFLGTGGYHPNERRHTACLFLPELGVMLDAGTSVFRVPARLETEELQIFLSHAHLDHIVGLTFLLVPLHTGKIKKMRLYGRQHVLNAVQNHLFAEPIFPVKPPFEFIPLEQHEQIKLPQGVVLTHQPLKSHPGQSTGFRLDWQDGTTQAQRSLAYITDTTVDDSYLEFVKGVSLLVHECYFSDEMSEWGGKTGHSHTTPVAELAQKAGVGRLMLVHIDPQHPEDNPLDLTVAKKIFPPTELAEDLLEIEL